MSYSTQTKPTSTVELPRGVRTGTLGLYIHLPFCRTKCTYCAFVSAPPQSDGEMDAYARAVQTHLRLGSLEADGMEVSTVFFGGGTPSLMGPKRLAGILQTIYEQYHLKPDVEITLEANPESAAPELFETLIPLGLNRVSMGAQSFHDSELQQIGRVHNSGQIATAIDTARSAGIQNISIDLIYGLPGQNMERWEQTVNRAVSLGVDHLSSYALSYEEGTLLHRQFASGKVTAVPDDTYVEMYHRLLEKARQAGFRHYEISNWCQPGMECRHNLIYWNRDEYLAFGVSAHGWFAGARYRVDSQVLRYIRSLESQVLERNYFALDCTEEIEAISSEETASDAMIFGLRLVDGIDCERFAKRFGYSPQERWGAAIERSKARGRLEHSNGRLRLTNDALMISNEVLQDFID